jgi:hypothetical protein
VLADSGIQIGKGAGAELPKLFHYLWDILLVSSKHIDQIRVYGDNGSDGICRLESAAGEDQRGSDGVIMSVELLQTTDAAA